MVYCIEELSSFEVFDLVTLLVMLLSCCCASGEISFIGLVKRLEVLQDHSC